MAKRVPPSFRPSVALKLQGLPHGRGGSVVVNNAPTDANAFIEAQLGECVRALEKTFDADVVAYSGPLLSGVDDVLRTVVESKASASSRKRLFVFLTTIGGYIQPVQRIVETFRHHYKHVSFVIPNHAFSAGTVLAMSGDAIYMDYYSRLGPIDPQVESDTGTQVPALGYLNRYERLLEKAQDGSITAAEVAILLNFDQAALYSFEQARELSITLLKEWLANYKFRDWNKTEGRGVKVNKKNAHRPGGKDCGATQRFR